jgi:hypothetical protein
MPADFRTSMSPQLNKAPQKTVLPSRTLHLQGLFETFACFVLFSASLTVTTRRVVIDP